MNEKEKISKGILGAGIECNEGSFSFYKAWKEPEIEHIHSQRLSPYVILSRGVSLAAHAFLEAYQDHDDSKSLTLRLEDFLKEIEVTILNLNSK